MSKPSQSPSPSTHPPSATEEWFDGIWKERDEQIYPALFGSAPPNVIALPASMFHSFGKKDPDPRFLTHAVFEYAPTSDCPYWRYVTSGMSNPWGESPETVDPANFSGLGYELILHASEKAAWATFVLQWIMAVQLLVATGEVDGQLIERHDRIPLGGSLWKTDGAITHLLVTEPPTVEQAEQRSPLPLHFNLPSGKVDWMHILGISAREAEFATSQGADALMTVLRHHEVFPVTNPARASVL